MFSRNKNKRIEPGDAFGVEELGKIDFANVYAVTTIWNKLNLKTCFALTLLENNKINSGNRFLGRVTTESRQIFAQAAHLDSLKSLKETVTNIVEIEKFIVTALITGEVSPTGLLDMKNCSTIEINKTSCKLYRQYINFSERHYYLDKYAMRTILAKLYQQARADGFNVSWDKLISELSALSTQQQMILNISTTESQDATNDKNNFLNIDYVSSHRVKNCEHGKPSVTNSIVDGTNALNLESTPSAKNILNDTINKVVQQMQVAQVVVKEDELIKQLAARRKVGKSQEDRNLEELILEYQNDEKLQVKLGESNYQDFIVWCTWKELLLPLAYNDKLVEAAEYAIRVGRKVESIESMDPSKWAIETNKTIGGVPAALWVVKARKEIDKKHPIAWLAINHPEIKLEGLDVISYAIKYKIKIGDYTAAEWLCRAYDRGEVTSWEKKEVHLWVVEKWLEDPRVLLEKSSPVAWCLNNNKKIGGKKVTDWLNEQYNNEGLFKALVLANFRNSQNEYLIFDEQIVDSANNVSIRSVMEDSVVWLMKTLSVNIAELIFKLVQEQLQMLKVENDGIEWLRINKGFDLIGHFINDKKSNFVIAGKGLGDLMSQSTDEFRQPAERGILIPNYRKIWEEKYNRFWGTKGNSADNVVGEVGSYESSGKDFWGAISSLNIFELDLIEKLIDEVEKDKTITVLNEAVVTPKSSVVAKYSPLKIFAKYGHNVNGINPDSGYAPLHHALSNINIVRLLIERYGADPNVKNNSGETSAHLAASVGRLVTLKYLADCGADLTVVNDQGQSIVEGAIIDHRQNDDRGRNRLDIIKYLVVAGTQELTPQTRTFLNFFKRSKPPQVQDVLLRTNASGKNVIQVAEELGKEDIVGFFRETIARRINGKLRMLLSDIYLPDPSRDGYTIPLILENPKQASAFALECTTALSSYLPYVIGSFFNRSIRAFKRIECHVDEFRHGKVIFKNVTVGGDIGSACQEVHRVFQMIWEHGVLRGIPNNCQLHSSTAVSNSSMPMIDDSEDDGFTIINPAVSGEVIADTPLFEIVPQKIINKHKMHVVNAFQTIRAKVLNNDIGDDVFSLENIYRDTNMECNTYITHYTKGLLQECKTKLQAEVAAVKKTVKAENKIPNDESDFKDAPSFNLFIRIHELVTGIQIKSAANQGWQKRLDEERNYNSDSRQSYASIAVGFVQSVVAGRNSNDPMELYL